MPKEIKRFGDMKPDPIPVDSNVEIDQIVGLDLEFREMQLLDGQFGQFAWIVAFDPEMKKTVGFSTGAKVVIKKMIEAKENGYLPLTGKIVKDKRYYDII
jgi:hypothetical protein